MSINVKKHWRTIAVIAAVVLALVFLARSCRLSDKYSTLKGQYEAYRAISIEDGKRLNALIGAKAAEIEALTRQITDIIAQAGQPSPAEAEKDKTIAALKKKVSALESQGDLAGALDAAKEQVVQLSEKFTLSEQRHGLNIAALNTAWQAKFDAQVTISESWKQQYEAEHRLRELAEGMNGVLERKVKRLQLTGKAKSLLVIAGAAYLGSTIVKGK